jgi:hypothetical protein
MALHTDFQSKQASLSASRDLKWRYMALHGVTWRYIALHGVTWRYMALHTSHHAEGRVDPKVREHQNGFRFWIPQSM